MLSTHANEVGRSRAEPDRHSLPLAHGFLAIDYDWIIGHDDPFIEFTLLRVPIFYCKITSHSTCATRVFNLCGRAVQFSAEYSVL